MKKIKHKTHKIKRFVKEDIWAMEMEELSRAKSRIIRYVKVLIITVKTYSQQRIGARATALSYLSMMAVVPFLAIVFGVTGGLGLDEMLKEFMYANLDSQSINTVMGYANNIIDTAQSGWMGFFSALFFIWIIFRLMMNVEASFNNVWKVKQNRSIVRRFSFYIAILLLAPFVIFMMFGGSFMYANAIEYMGLNVEEMTFVKNLISWIIFVLMATLVFSVMYKFIPNYKVNYSAAFKAALIAAIAFGAVQFFNIETQILVTRFYGVYGTFAAVPLFMIWLNLSWNIILIGAEVSYAFQHVDSYNIED